MRGRWRGRAARRAGGMALVCAGFLLMSGDALGAPAWLPAINLTAPGQDGEIPQVAVDPRGDATAVWEHNNGTDTIIQAATRPAGGGWGPPVDLSAGGKDSFAPDVAVDARGDATAVWERSTGVGSDTIQQAAFRPAGGVWQAPADLSAAGQTADEVRVAVDPQGNATAVWNFFDGVSYVVQAASRPAGGAWGPPANLSVSAAGRSGAAPRVAYDAHGDVIVVWYRFNGANTIVQAASRPAGGAWQAPVDVSLPGGSATAPQVAVDPAGDATAVWQRSNGANNIVQAAVLPAGGVWQLPVDLSVAGQDAEFPQVALDAHGNATAIWDRSNGTYTIVQAAMRLADGVWQAPANVSAGGEPALIAQVAVDPQGDASAVWYRSNGTDWIVQAARNPAGGTWQAPVDLADAGTLSPHPQVATDGHGNSTAVWFKPDGSNAAVQAAGLDAAGPLLDGLSVPASGVAGVPVSFSVSPLDVWSPVATTGWNFGDGRSADGASVSHTYGAPGTYTVSLTSADTLANVTSATVSIAIASVPAASAVGAPALRNVSQSHRVWREGNKRAILARRPSRRPPIGTSFAFTLNMRARLGLAFTQTATGRIVSGRCRALSARNRTHRRCRLTVTRGTLSFLAPSGAHRIAFQGRIVTARLPRGAYTLLIAAANTTTGQRSRTQTLRFTIVK